MTAYIEPMIGRYAHVDIDGTTHRIYFEEAGQGIPLVCLHTAGSDSGAICWRTKSSRRTTASSPSICPGTASRTRPPIGTAANIS